jgi:hypothetical protein
MKDYFLTRQMNVAEVDISSWSWAEKTFDGYKYDKLKKLEIDTQPPKELAEYFVSEVKKINTCKL